MALLNRRNGSACDGDGTFALTFQQYTEAECMWIAVTTASFASSVAWPQLAGYQPLRPTCLAASASNKRAVRRHRHMQASCPVVYGNDFRD